MIIDSNELRYTYFLALFVSMFLPMPFSPILNYVLGAVLVIFLVCWFSLLGGFSVNTFVFASWILVILAFCFSLVANSNNTPGLLSFSRELLKVVFFPLFLYFSLLLVTSRAERFSKNKVEAYFWVFLGLQLVIIVFYSMGGVVAEIASTLFYDGKTRAGINLFGGHIRNTGSFENPNYLGLVTVLLSSWFFSKYKWGWRDVAFVVVSGLTVASTGSRTAVIAFAAIFLVSILRKPRSYFWWALLGFLLFPYVISWIGEIKRISDIVTIEGILSSKSLVTRWEVVKESFLFFVEKPVFGYFSSPVKVTDNLFALILLRYGVFFVLMTLIFVSVVLFLFRDRISMQSLLFPALALLIFSLMGAFLDNPRLFVVATMLSFLVSAKWSGESGDVAGPTGHRVRNNGVSSGF